MGHSLVAGRPGDPKGRDRKLKTDIKDNITMSAEEPC
jgi:hypothetical protein